MGGLFLQGAFWTEGLSLHLTSSLLFSMLPWVLRDSRNIYLIKETIHGNIFVPFLLGKASKKLPDIQKGTWVQLIAKGTISCYLLVIISCLTIGVLCHLLMLSCQSIFYFHKVLQSSRLIVTRKVVIHIKISWQLFIAARRVIKAKTGFTSSVGHGSGLANTWRNLVSLILLQNLKGKHCCLEDY